MVATINSYDISEDDQAVTIPISLFEDNGEAILTTSVIVAFTAFTAQIVEARIRDVLKDIINAKKPAPTQAQLKAILPIGFKITEPG